MKKIFASVVSLIFTVTATAQTFTNYTTDSGLVNNDVLCSSIASGDVMWFGTQEGVAVYDGTTWATHTTTTDSGLVHNTISAILVLSNGDVWVGTDYGASHWDGANWTTYDESDGLGDNRVKHIAEEANGDIWFGTNDGVSRLANSVWTSWGTAEGLPFGGVTSINFDSNGDKWLGTGLGGIAIFDDLNFTMITETDRLLNDKIRAIGIDDDGNRWIGTADGVSVYNPDNYLVEHHTVMLVLPPPDTLNPVEDLKIAGNGNIWTGVYVDYLVTEGGIAMFDGETWWGYDVSDGLVGPVIRSLAIDSQDNIWVTTSTGISKISNLPNDPVDHWLFWDNDPAYPEDTITVSMLEVKEISTVMNIYPVPAHNTVTISADSNIDKVEIISMNGALLTSLEFEGTTSISIPLSELLPGLYLARVQVEEGIETLRFMKE